MCLTKVYFSYVNNITKVQFRRVLELEMTFLYLCMHGGGLLDMAALGSNLKIAQQTVLHFIELLEATHLIYRLPPFGYGKEVLRARYKVY